MEEKLRKRFEIVEPQSTDVYLGTPRCDSHAGEENSSNTPESTSTPGNLGAPYLATSWASMPWQLKSERLTSSKVPASKGSAMRRSLTSAERISHAEREALQLKSHV